MGCIRLSGHTADEAPKSLSWPGRHQSSGKESTPAAPRGSSSVWLSCRRPPAPLARVTVTAGPGQCQPASNVFSPVGFLYPSVPVFCLLTPSAAKSLLSSPNAVYTFYLCYLLTDVFFVFSQQSKSVWHSCAALGLGAHLPKPVVGLGRSLWQRLHREGVYKWQLLHCSSVWCWVISRMFCTMLDTTWSFWNMNIEVCPETLLDVGNRM